MRIARLSGTGSRTGQRPVINRLVRQGIVLAELANTGYLYKLNRQHVLAPSVIAAASARLEILRRLRAAIEELDPPVLSAAVTGPSPARRRARTAMWTC
jgi:hypothetical protein